MEEPNAAHEEARRRAGFSVANALYLFVCAAVALTIAAPVPRNDYGILGWSPYQPQVEWRYALLGVTTLGAIGVLLQQVRTLSGRADASFAIAERLLVASALLAALVLRLLTQRGVIELAENPDFIVFGSRQVQDSLWLVLLIVGTAVAAGERPRTAAAKLAWARLTLAATLGWLALAIAADAGFITYLVHVAIDGVETNTPPQFSVQPKTADFGFRHSIARWSFAASVAYCVALVTTVGMLQIRRASIATTALLATVAGIALAAAAGFSAWYFSVGLAKLSPCMAVAAPVANWTDGVTGGLIALAACAWFARGQSRQETDGSGDAPHVERFNSLSLLLLLAGGIGGPALVLIESVYATLSWIVSPPLWGGVGSWSDLSETLSYWFTDSQNLLPLALLLISIRILNACRRSQPVAYAVVDLQRFALLTVLFALLATVGAPTLAAYSFCSWLGPWYL